MRLGGLGIVAPDSLAPIGFELHFLSLHHYDHTSCQEIFNYMEQMLGVVNSPVNWKSSNLKDQGFPLFQRNCFHNLSLGFKWLLVWHKRKVLQAGLQLYWYKNKAFSYRKWPLEMLYDMVGHPPIHLHTVHVVQSSLLIMFCHVQREDSINSP